MYMYMYMWFVHAMNNVSTAGYTALDVRVYSLCMKYFSELGVAKTEGFADDYAFLIRGLLDLFEAGQDERWLEWVWQLQQKMNELFWDKEGGGYFTATTSDPSILIRMKEGNHLTTMVLAYG